MHLIINKLKKKFEEKKCRAIHMNESIFTLYLSLSNEMCEENENRRKEHDSKKKELFNVWM